MDQNRPGNCYASMIAPLDGLQVKGAIFHQGYNNCFKGTQGAIMYRRVFPEMIKAWRAAFNNSEMPFGILSLCTEGAVQTLDNYSEMMANTGPYIREAQYQTFLDFYKAGDTQIGFVSTYDLRRRWYHPQFKVPAGERIAPLDADYDRTRPTAPPGPARAGHPDGSMNAAKRALTHHRPAPLSVTNHTPHPKVVS